MLNIMDNDNFVAVVNDEPKKCSYISCSTCKNNETPGKCTANFVKWLYQEYEEKPTLSRKAYHFLKALPDNARIKYSGLLLFMQTGDKIVNTSYFNNEFIPALSLPPDKWVEVSDLLTWDVKDD